MLPDFLANYPTGSGTMISIAQKILRVDWVVLGSTVGAFVRL